MTSTAEAPQITGHSPEVWARHHVRSFGKPQRDEARDRMLEHGFGQVRWHVLAPRIERVEPEPASDETLQMKVERAGIEPATSGLQTR